MASSKIKGITIEIGGNTTKLQDALKGVDKQVYSLNGDLKALNQALKLDPKNTELLAQKHEVLARNIQASKDRLETLKEAQRQMGSYNKLTDEQKTSYNQLSLEIAKSESALKSMNEELRNSSKVDLSKLKDGLKKVGDVALDVSKQMLKVTAAVTGALTAVVGAGVKSYADLEKAQKGSERLFGDSFKTVQKNAVRAYETIGISAKDYYDQVNTYAVGLKESLGGDTEKSAKLANDILVAQADIVAATGANQDAVQNAFAAVMRGNFTMIDNLRLGIKGSKEGMQEVINKVNKWNKSQGHATKYQITNYADMQKALIDYTKMTGVAGTASQQMSSTISGSIGQMKAAWDNFINDTGNVAPLAASIKKVLKNIGTVVQKLFPTIVKGLAETMKEILPMLDDILWELLPNILDTISELIDFIYQSIEKDSKNLSETISMVINNLILFIRNNLPKIVKIALQIVLALAEGIIDNIDELIPAVIECIIQIIETITQNLPKILSMGISLVVKLAEGLIKGLPELVKKLPEIITGIVGGLKEGNSEMVKVGKQLIEGMWNGIKLQWDYYKAVGGGNGLQGWARKVVQDIKNIFGIHSPSTVMRNEIGKNLGLGVAEGINDTISDVEEAMSNLSSGVEASVNPTINPTANSNPLFITIDKFYNNRETDIQQLAEELEFYRKNSALAKGGV